MSEKKMRITIDYYETEDGYEIYFVCNPSNPREQADCVMGSGFYKELDYLDSDIEEWEKEYDLEIVEDCR